MKPVAILVLISGVAISVIGCGGASAPGQNPSEFPAQPSAESGSGEGGAARPTISAQACEANGGSVVGDIGDGAIHRPEYRCVNGAKPTANIGAPEGGPIAIEGSVCCPH